MNHETDKELADRLDAKKRIRDHGGTWKTCHRCKGAGYDFPHNGMVPCFICNGRGGEWEFPMMRMEVGNSLWVESKEDYSSSRETIRFTFKHP